MWSWYINYLFIEFTENVLYRDMYIIIEIYDFGHIAKPYMCVIK